MPFYREHVYPYIVDRVGNPEPIRRVRKDLLSLASGVALEIGVGSGANLPYYDPSIVKKLYALEPNIRMIELARKRRRLLDLEVEFLPATGERIPMENSAVDKVISTFTLCTIPNPIEAVRSIRRVLKPGGRLLFFEHLRSPDKRIERWQRRWEPLHSRLFEGLRLTLDTPELLAMGGLQLEQIQSGYLASFPKSWTYFCWGIAIKSPI